MTSEGGRGQREGLDKRYRGGRGGKGGGGVYNLDTYHLTHFCFRHSKQKFLSLGVTVETVL